MPVPTHYPNCETHIFRTKCQFCNEQVYFFSCTCGSKVYFDLNEPPWNPHENRCYRYLIWHLINVMKTPSQEIRSIIEEYSSSTGIPIPVDVNTYIDELEGNNHKRKIKLNKVVPEDEETAIVASVISINLNVNFFKRFNLFDNQVGRGLLGKLLKSSFIEVQLRQETGSSNVYNEYIVFIPADIYNQEPFHKNSILFMSLKPHKVTGRGKVWLVIESHVVT